MIISYSFLKAFEKCPFQQKLIRIDKVRPERIDERRFIAGTVGHKFFQIWTRRGFDNEMIPEAAGRIFDRLIRRKYIMWRDKSDCGQTRERVIKEASLLIEAVRHHGIDKVNDAQIECFSLKTLPDGQNSVGGIIDFIANNGSWIIEIKMSADLKWADPDQLLFYGLLLASIQRRYPTRLSFFLPIMPDTRDQIIEVEFSNHNFFSMYDRIKHLISLWDTRNFPAAVDSNTCYFCNVKAYCPSNPSHDKNKS
jgi:CRISPR/Cas system-associated exonuclease Cas4 (RecB family)